ncbi:MAG: PEP-CTERM sorting domain-containing protein [Oceanipulchritudo sp.]
MKSVNILLKTLLLSSPLVLSTTIFGAIIVQEDFNSYSLGDIGNQGDWQLYSDNTGPGTLMVGTTGTTFSSSDNPFGGTVGNTVIGNFNDGALIFTPRAAGESTYFSYNYLALDNTTANHLIDFKTTSTNSPLLRTALSGSIPHDISVYSHTATNADSGSGVFSEDVGYFIYGKIDASTDLKTFTISLNVTDDVSTIPGTESWSYTSSFTYGVARDSNVNAMSFDMGSNRGLIDNIRIGETYADVTAVPEPSTYALLAGFATLGLVLFRRRLMR